MNTFSMRVDYDDGSWQVIQLKARTCDNAYREAVDMAKSYALDGELRLLETTWREVCTTPHIINIDKM